MGILCGSRNGAEGTASASAPGRPPMGRHREFPRPPALAGAGLLRGVARRAAGAAAVVVAAVVLIGAGSGGSGQQFRRQQQGDAVLDRVRSICPSSPGLAATSSSPSCTRAEPVTGQRRTDNSSGLINDMVRPGMMKAPWVRRSRRRWRTEISVPSLPPVRASGGFAQHAQVSRGVCLRRRPGLRGPDARSVVPGRAPSTRAWPQRPSGRRAQGPTGHRGPARQGLRASRAAGLPSARARSANRHAVRRGHNSAVRRRWPAGQGRPSNRHRRTSKSPPPNCGRRTLNTDELHPRHHRLLPPACGAAH